MLISTTCIIYHWHLSCIVIDTDVNNKLYSRIARCNFLLSFSNIKIWRLKLISFIHSFHWHVQNSTIPCRSQEFLPFLSAMYFFPVTLPQQLFFYPLSPHLAIYFLIYFSILLFPNPYIILFWEFYFLPFPVHVQTNIIYLTFLSLL